jgi:DNA transformation protein and related proteins
MANTTDFVDHVLELARSAGRVDARAMFGGHGIYVDGVIVGIVIDDTLYLKTDDATLGAFEALSLPAFEYVTKDGRRTVMSYHMAPDEALESPDAMRDWLKLAHEAARRAAATKPVKKRPAGVRRRV